MRFRFPQEPDPIEAVRCLQIDSLIKTIADHVVFEQHMRFITGRENQCGELDLPDLSAEMSLRIDLDRPLDQAKSFLQLRSRSPVSREHITPAGVAQGR